MTTKNNDLIPGHWRDYQLLDCGNRMKLEKFGPNILIRPEPEAIWKPDMPGDDWSGMANARFVESKSEGGKWTISEGAKKSWRLNYAEPGIKLNCNLKLSRMKNIGLFPEQAPNWQYIYNAVKAMPHAKPRILNLFAHTGLSSVAAAKAGADVYHVESAKQFITWANENAALNNVSGIRWVAEDVMKFVHREVKRGHLYNGIIADPPVFGTGPSNEKWVIQKHLPELIDAAARLLDPEHHFIILNTYGSALAPNTLSTLLNKNAGPFDDVEKGALTIKSARDHYLTMGTFARVRNF